jgi:3',5'-cyclic AMP phosphodiesterase CpdA
MMSAMTLIVQLTDPHIGAPWSDDPSAALERAIGGIRPVLGRTPDALLVTGDVANTPLEAEYATAKASLERIGAPVYVIPGNHDDRDLLRRVFPAPRPAVSAGPRQELQAAHDASYSYAVTLGPIRLVALDTTRPGEAGGQLDPGRLAWLDGALADDGGTPTLLGMHHPPIDTGQPGMDEIGFPESETAALAEVLGRHPQVQMIACGHVHRAIAGAIAGVPVLAIPSSDVQLALDFESPELRFVPEPPCFAVHTLAGGRLVSHVQPINATTG